MDTATKLIVILIISTITTAANPSSAGSAAANVNSWLNHQQQYYYRPGSGDQFVRNSANGDRFVKVESPVNYKAQNGRNYPVVIEKTGQIDAGRVGKAVSNFAKKVGPLAMAIATVDLICELSEICPDNDNPGKWQKAGSGDPNMPETTGNTRYYITGFPQYAYPTPELACHYSASVHNFWGPNHTGIATSSTNCHVTNNTTGNSFNTGLTQATGCPMNYTLSGGVCVNNNPPTPPTEPTDIDWQNVETSLNDERFDEPLLIAGEPVPIASLPVFGNHDPVDLYTDTQTLYDSNNNVTGTRVTETQLILSDGATSTNPGQVNGIEKTTITEYDDQNQQVSKTETEANSPPPEQTEPPTIEFDTVSPAELETEEVSLQLDNPTSWGQGTCPANVDLGIYGLTVSYQPACDTAAQLKPIFIFLASVTAMFIVAGFRKDS